MHLMPLLRAKRSHFDLAVPPLQETVPWAPVDRPFFLKVNREHRFLGLPSPPAILFLGQFHPLGSYPDPETWRKNGKIEEQWFNEALADPDQHPDLLSYLLSLPAPAARAVYLCALNRMVEMGEESAIPVHHFDAIRGEHTLFRSKDKEWLARRVFPHLRPIEGRHLLWAGAMRRPTRLDQHADRPCVNWYDSKDVPVHRLLWPYAHGTDILQPRERLRRTQACPESEYPLCVNPRHYEHSDAMTTHVQEEGRQGRSLKTQRASEYPSYTYRWHADSVRTVNGKEYVFCPAGHAFSERVQDALLLARTKGEIPGGQADCPWCKKLYEAATGGQRMPRRKVPGNAQTRDISRDRDMHIALQSDRDAVMHIKPKRKRDPEEKSDEQFAAEAIAFAMRAQNEGTYEDVTYYPDEEDA
jgi:hypothetical protein